MTWPTYILTAAPGWHVENKLERDENEIGEAAVRTQEVTVAWTSVVVSESGSEDGDGFANGHDTLFLKPCTTLKMRTNVGILPGFYCKSLEYNRFNSNSVPT